MSKELTRFNPADIMSIGKAFAESGMFQDTKTAAQAIVKIQAGQELGIPPFAAMTGIHIISGKPTIGAGLIASTVKGSGKYDFRVLENTDKVCKIEFFQGKESIGISTFTIEDAKKAGTKNLEKFPRNMLYARAMSNGVKWYCPDVFSGPVYVPEEMQEVQQQVEDVAAEVIPVEKPFPNDKQWQQLLTKAATDKDTVSKAQQHFTLNLAQINKLQDAYSEPAGN